MNVPHILIIDDEPSVRLILEKTLKGEGYYLETASNGREGLQKLNDKAYDLLLLDLRIGKIDGLQVLKKAREKDEDLVVIILTGHGSIESAVEGLRQGAFDYLFKPAVPDTIRQRVRAGLQHRQKAVRRRSMVAQVETLRQALNQLDADSGLSPYPTTSSRFVDTGKLIMDRHHRVATFDEKLLDLTTTEFDFLLSLINSSPETISARQLVKQVMGYDSEDHEARRIAKWHIHNLRNKIEPNPENPRYIKTIRYKGYLWVSE